MALFTEKRRRNSNENFSVHALRVGEKGRKVDLPPALQMVLQNDAVAIIGSHGWTPFGESRPSAAAFRHAVT